jgi:hypothetical protein
MRNFNWMTGIVPETDSVKIAPGSGLLHAFGELLRVFDLPKVELSRAGFSPLSPGTTQFNDGNLAEKPLRRRHNLNP